MFVFCFIYFAVDIEYSMNSWLEAHEKQERERKECRIFVCGDNSNRERGGILSVFIVHVFTYKDFFYVVGVMAPTTTKFCNA